MSVHERFYGLATQEIEEGVRREDLWTKAYVLSGGDAQKAKVLYIELLAQLMADNSAMAEKQAIVGKAKNNAKLFWRKIFYFCRILLSVIIIMWLWSGIFSIIQKMYVENTGRSWAPPEEIALNWPGTFFISICILFVLSWVTWKLLVRT